MADDERREMPFITKALIVGIMAILVIIISAGISYMVVSSAVDRLNIPEKTEEEMVEKETPKALDMTPGMMLPFGSYTVNLRDEEPRYLVCEIQLEFDNSGKDKGAAVLAELVGKEGGTALQVIAQDKVIGILSSKSIADLKSDPGNEKLKVEIVTALRALLKNGDLLKNVYFVQWVIQ